jgi:thiol-disulfide isomerase/thioredoxin
MKKLAFVIMTGWLALFISGCGEPPVASIGEPAPDFDTIDLNGDIWSLSQMKGQVVFINFWATWCAPCREEMPSMQRLYAKLPKNKFKMIALYNRDKPPIVKDFVAKLGVTMPILDDQENIIGQRYGLTGLPETFIVDKQGIVREKFIGPAEWDTPRFIDLLMKYINE